MKYIFQFAIISGITFVAEVLNILLPFPVPASIYGMVILFLLLCLKVIRPEQIQDAADFLLGIMPIFFISANVGLMKCFDVMDGATFGILFAASFVSTIVTLAVTALVSQAIIRICRRRGKHE